MNKNQKRSLVLASIIGTLFDTYEEENQTKLHKELHARVGKGIRKKASSYTKELVVEITHIDGKKIWDKAVDHFKKNGISIEASHCVLAICNLDEKALSKHYGLGKGVLEKWAKPCRREDAKELEQNSNEVAKFVFNEASEFYGIEIEKKMSVMERIEKARKVA